MKAILLILSISLASFLHAQDTTTVNVQTPGTLDSLLRSNGRKLIVTGRINKLDFDVLKAKAKDGITSIDLSNVQITAIVVKPPYTGRDSLRYSANEIPTQTFQDCYDLASVILPSSLKSIGFRSFFCCAALTTITIPSSVTSIGADAFGGCFLTTSLHVKSSVPIVFPSAVYALGFNNRTCRLYVPRGSRAAYQAANQWKDFTNILEEGPLSATTEAVAQDIQLYPNPVENELSVAGIEGNASIQIVTLEGKSLLNQTIKSNEKVNVTQLPAGLYIARITTADGKIEKKIVKQ